LSRFREGLDMKNLFVVGAVVCASLCTGLAGTAAFARGGSHGGGMGMHHSSSAMTGIPVTGGAFGERPGSPGTNSLGTALSTSGFSNSQRKGPLLGTSAAVDREDAKVEKMIGSICRGC
jgi:hypothetical protein